jgi:hypothetical protein
VPPLLPLLLVLLVRPLLMVVVTLEVLGRVPVHPARLWQVLLLRHHRCRPHVHAWQQRPGPGWATGQ